MWFGRVQTAEQGRTSRSLSGWGVGARQSKARRGGRSLIGKYEEGRARQDATIAVQFGDRKGSGEKQDAAVVARLGSYRKSTTKVPSAGDVILGGTLIL